MTPTEVMQKALGCFNDGDRAGWMAYASPDIAINDYGNEPGDINRWGGAYDMLHAAFSDARCEFTRGVEGNGFIAGEYRFDGILPTGKTISFFFGGLSKVENDLIILDNSYGLASELEDALGSTPTP